MQDGDGALNLIERCRNDYPTLYRFFADGGYAGQPLADAIAHIDCLVIEIIRSIRSMTRRIATLELRVGTYKECFLPAC